MSRQTAPEVVATSKEIALPDGQLLNLSDIPAVARTYDDLQRLKAMIREAEGTLKEVLIKHSGDLGQKTFSVEGAKVEVKGGNETRYDAQGLKRAFKEAGMPEDRIKEIVRETIEYKVAAVEAKRAARANEKYAEIIEQHSTVEKKTPSVSVKRIGGSAATPLKRPAEKDEMTASELSAPADALPAGMSGETPESQTTEAISAPADDEEMPW